LQLYQARSANTIEPGVGGWQFSGSAQKDPTPPRSSRFSTTAAGITLRPRDPLLMTAKARA
jgi:hypothetical protein